MDKPHQIPDTGLVTEEFREGLQKFMAFAVKQKKAKKIGKIYCLCTNCRNRRLIVIDEVWSHLYCHGFVSDYKIWYNHGENDTIVDNYASTSEKYIGDSAIFVEPAMEVESTVGHVQMVNDAFRASKPSVAEYGDRGKEPNAEAQKFFDMLDAAKNPLYDGCRSGHSPLSAATKMMGIKTDFNLSEECVDAIADFVKNILREDNLAPASYYETQKLVVGLRLPFQMIDVCIDNCMIYWREDPCRSTCRFRCKLRYKETGGRVLMPYKRMWYLPLTDRLKRLYQLERTVVAMRWHAEHKTDGEIAHPSDARA